MLTLTELSPRLNLLRLSLLRPVEDSRRNCAQVPIDWPDFANDEAEKTAMLADSWLAESMVSTTMISRFFLQSDSRKSAARTRTLRFGGRARHRFRKLKIPNAIGARISDAGVAAYVESARDFELNILDCRESSFGGDVRYIGA
jgi:hypothetical protein